MEMFFIDLLGDSSSSSDDNSSLEELPLVLLSDFEYIKVPKQQSDLSFGSKTDRTVFPDIPGVIKGEQVLEINTKQSNKKVRFGSGNNRHSTNTAL